MVTLSCKYSYLCKLQTFILSIFLYKKLIKNKHIPFILLIFITMTTEYQLEPRISNRFYEMTTGAVLSCVNQYIDSYNEEPGVYGLYLGITIPIVFKDKNIEKSGLILNIVRNLPLRFLNMCVEYYFITLNKNIIIGAINNKDEKVLKYILNEYVVNYNVHCDMINFFVTNPQIPSNSYYDTLFKHYGGEILICSNITSDSFALKYSDFLREQNISIAKKMSGIYYTSLFLEKAGYVEKYDIEDNIIENFSIMSSKGLIKCVTQYINDYYNCPDVFASYIKICLNYLVSDKITSVIISNLPLDMVKYSLSRNQIYRENINHSDVLFALQNKNKDVLEYILFNFKQSFTSHMMLINTFMNNKEKYFKKVYDYLIESNFGSYEIGSSCMCDVVNDVIWQYVNGLGYDIVKNNINDYIYSLSIVKKPVTRCFVKKFGANGGYVKLYDLKRLEEKYQDTGLKVAGGKYYKKCDGKYMIYKCIEKETYYSLLGISMFGMFDTKYMQVVESEHKEIYII
jgi:hypothetical protein